MKNKAYKHHHKRVLRYFDEWIPKLGLGWWKITLRGYDRMKDYRRTTGADQYGIMQVGADWEYLTATIFINMPKIALLDDRELEEAVVHELCHLLVIEADEQEGHRKHVERVVTNLAKIFIWQRQQ